MFLVALIATTGAWADELTVFEGDATNSYVPVYGFYADAYLKSEVVMPASELSAMNGGEISAMSFYLSTPASAAWTSTFQVFLKEVSETTLSAFSGLEGATVVYEGLLNATGTTMDIEFDTPYTYNGGNLLIGIYNVEQGNYSSANFAGTTVSGASVQGYSYTSLDAVSPTQRNFIPKTTFTYGASGYDLSVGKTEHGTIEFTVGGTAADKAEEGAEVTVTVTPVDGWAINEVEARPYIGWGAVKAPSQAPEILKIELVPVDGIDNQWAFEMPAYPVEVSATYQKIIQPDWIEPIEDLTFTGKAIEPELFITDGDKILVAGTDYTVTYADNLNVGEATVTVTGIDYYTGEVVLHFNIVRLEDPVFISPTAVEGLVFNGEEQALIIPGSVDLDYASMLYSLSNATSSFSAEIPTAKDAAQYTVYYKVSGNANVKGTGLMSLTVAIAPKPAEDVDLKLEVKEDGSLSIGDGETELIEGVDYDLTIKDAKGNVVNQEVPETDDAPALRRAINLNDLGLPAGEYKAIIDLKGNYSGQLEKEFTYEGATGINEIVSQKETVNGEFYNINGQRVSQPTKGLYIVNGRKVVIK